MSQARIDECRAALASANVLAFLRLIREGESTQTDDAYWWLYGSTKSRTILAETLADHPRKRTYEEYDGQFIKNGKLDYTTAFGAYQITATTWDTNVQPAMHLPDITPASQDLAAVYLLRFRGALADVIDGRIEQAIAKCRNEWVSLPGARVGDQPSQHLRRALQVYLLYGGQIAGAAAATPQDPAPPEPAEAPQATTPQPAPENAPSAAPVEPQVPFRQPTEDDLQSGRAFQQPEKSMALQAFLIPAALELAKLIPRVGGLFASGSEVSQRNLKLAEMVVDTIVPAVGAANAQEAVERIKADPQALKQASQAIDENWFRFEDVREKSVAAAREMYATRDRIVLANMVFHEVLALVIVCMTAAGMTAAFIGGDLSQSTKDNIVMLGLVGGFIGIKEFFFGGSRGSDTKTAIMERRQ